MTPKLARIFKSKATHLWVRAQIALYNNMRHLSSPLFSVVIPIYDRTEELRQAIDSILAQNFMNYEILLICDGSPKKTMAVVKTYASNSKVRTFNFLDTSGNPCRGRNKGIEMARGKFITFLDSDDLAVPDRLEKTLYHFLTKKVDVVAGAIQYMTNNKKMCRGFYNGQIGYTSPQCNYKLLLQGNRLSICTVSVKTRCLKKHGGFRKAMRYREDHELWLRLAYHGCTFHNTPEVLAHYRIHEENAELNYLENDHIWFEQALELHKKPFFC